MSEINNDLNEVFEETMDDSTVITVPIDATLSMEGYAADAAAVGEVLAGLGRIKVNAEEADNQGQIYIDGTGIPMSDTDETTLQEAIAAEQGKTAADIPMSDDPEAETIAAAVAEAKEAGEGAVRTVNGLLPDDGNVTLNKVPLADNLDSTVRQNSSGDYIIRTAGGAASLSDGPAALLRVSGNSVRTGYTPESVDFNVSGESIDASITDMDTFRTEMGDSGTLTLSYSGSWSEDPADYGITVVGTPENGDSIIVDWVKEIRGVITNATPAAFGVTGWNLYNQTAGYARVVRYSEEYGYKISGSYSALAFSETESGAQTAITPDSSGLFMVPADGFLHVTGGNSTTAIWATWSDWINGYSGDFQAYTKSTISLSTIMGTLFPDGLCAVEGVRDYIDIAGGYAYNWVDVLEYSAENLAVAEASGRAYLYDENNILLARASALITALSGVLAISGAYTVNGHGLEMFDGSAVAVGGMTSYGVDLKNKLERDVLTKSQQTLSASEQAQVRENIGAASAAEVSGVLDKMVKVVDYSYTVSSLAAGAALSITANTFGVSTPAGYKPTSIAKYYVDSNFNLYFLNCRAIGTDKLLSIKNMSNSAQTNKNITLSIEYVKSSLT
ncbi:MAG: hypothetical protein J6S83_03390 [Lachnospiraceae bacterium]|nr:hypothetical protein [Lachnospiraceae bacterium]